MEAKDLIKPHDIELNAIEQNKNRNRHKFYQISRICFLCQYLRYYVGGANIFFENTEEDLMTLEDLCYKLKILYIPLGQSTVHGETEQPCR